MRRRGRGLTGTVEPVVDHHTVKVQLVDRRWGKMRMSPPGWLGLTRRFPLAPLPLGTSIVEGRRRGRDVEVCLGVASVNRNIDAAVVREAILRRLPIRVR